MSPGPDATRSNVHDSLEYRSRVRREANYYNALRARIFDYFRPYSPQAVVQNDRLQRRGEPPHPLWVEERSGPIPRFAVQDMAPILRRAFLDLNGLRRFTEDFDQRAKALDRITRESIQRLMVPRGELRYDFDRVSPNPDSMQFDFFRRPDTRSLDHDQAYQQLSAHIANQDDGFALRYANGHAEPDRESVQIESGLIPLPITGSYVESWAHSLQKLCQGQIESYRQWTDIPKGVRSELLRSNSFAALILTMRFMGFQQNRLIGTETVGVRHFFQDSILNHPDLSSKFGKFDEDRRANVIAFVRRIFNYGDDQLWDNQGDNIMFPKIGWDSLRGLAQQDILELAESLDGDSLLIPVREDDEQESVIADQPDWLAATEYQRLVRYRALYASLLQCLEEDRDFWSEVLEDNLWRRHVVGTKWTNVRKKYSLDLFPFLHT